MTRFGFCYVGQPRVRTKGTPSGASRCTRRPPTRSARSSTPPRQQAAVLQFDPAAGRAVQHLFVRRGKLLSRAFLFDLALKTACTARPARPTGRPTVSAHRFRHTIGTQLAEGGARLQRIMTDLGYRTPAMSLIYASLSDPTRQTAVRRRPRQGRRPGRAPRRAVSR